MNTTTTPSVPPPGVWAPAITFFTNDALDLPVQSRYFHYLSQHLTGLVILGTNAETFLLTRSERSALLHCAREAVGPSYPLMAGVGGHSTAQVLEYLADAAAAKADYALVLPCAYFGKATSPAVVRGFYDEIAAKSPLPLLIYNFPGVCNGVDIESDVMSSLARRWPGKIVGTKLTCASVGKVTRLAAEFPEGAGFKVFGGQADFLVGGLAVGSAGCIAAFANAFPKTIRRVYELYRAGKVEEAMALHRPAALAELVCKSGIAATKYAVSLTSAKAAGIEGAEEMLKPRRPYEPLSEAVKREIQAKLKEMIEIEAGL